VPAFSRFLRYFMVVGRQGSIRRAAEQLHVSASAVDRQILNAEAEIGMPLFERLPSGLRLTAAGEILMAAGARWQKSLIDVRAQMGDLQGLKRGHVDIAVIDALAGGYIPTIVHRVQKQFPGITISLKVLENLRVRDAIVSGEVDFGIFLEPQTFRDLTVRAHVEVVLGFVTRPDHLLSTQLQSRFSGCAGSKLVVPAEPLALCQQVSVLEGVSGFEADIAASSDNIQMIKSLVAEGIGVGVLTSLDVIPEVAAGTLAFTRISDPILRPMTLALCAASSRQLSSAANVVLAEIENNFSQLGYSEAEPFP
jgi:DNA-binding transcriptional LysR family regulator